MNADTWFKDIEKIDSGSIIIFNENVKLPVERMIASFSGYQ